MVGPSARRRRTPFAGTAVPATVRVPTPRPARSSGRAAGAGEVGARSSRGQSIAPRLQRTRSECVREFLDHAGEAADDAGGGVEVDLVGGVGGEVVVLVAERGGVGDHEGGVADLVEAAVVGPVDLVDLARGGGGEEGEGLLAVERRGGRADEVLGL